MSQKREQKICALVIWMNIAFLVCWLPYGVICIIYIFGGRGYVSPTVVVIPLLMAKTSVCWNPIIYIAMNPQVNSHFPPKIDIFTFHNFQNHIFQRSHFSKITFFQKSHFPKITFFKNSHFSQKITF